MTQIDLAGNHRPVPQLPQIEDFDRLVRVSARHERQRGLLIYSIVLVCMTAWFGFTIYKITTATSQITRLSKTIADLGAVHNKIEIELGEHRHEVERLTGTIDKMGNEVGRQQRIRTSLFAFMSSVTHEANPESLAPDVDWEKTQAEILATPSESRQLAALSAVLMSWSKAPFKFGGASLKEGIDSSRFVSRVLHSVHVANLPEVRPWREGEPRYSDQLLKILTETHTPETGDLMTVWISNTSGRLVVFYLGNGTCLGNGIVREGISIFNCEKSAERMGWKNPIQYWKVVYPN